MNIAKKSRSNGSFDTTHYSLKWPTRKRGTLFRAEHDASIGTTAGSPQMGQFAKNRFKILDKMPSGVFEWQVS